MIWNVAIPHSATKIPEPWCPGQSTVHVHWLLACLDTYLHIYMYALTLYGHACVVSLSLSHLATYLHIYIMDIVPQYYSATLRVQVF